MALFPNVTLKDVIFGLIEAAKDAACKMQTLEGLDCSHTAICSIWQMQSNDLTSEKVLQELVETEKTYCDGLLGLSTHFKRFCIQNQAELFPKGSMQLPQTELDIFYSAMHDISSSHRDAYDDLTLAVATGGELTQTFGKISAAIKDLYPVHVNRQDLIFKAINQVIISY